MTRVTSRIPARRAGCTRSPNKHYLSEGGIPVYLYSNELRACYLEIFQSTCLIKHTAGFNSTKGTYLNRFQEVIADPLGMIYMYDVLL